MSDAPNATTRLLAVMAALRHPQTGCPWDRAQDFATIAPYTIEEAYEVQSAILTGDPAQLKDELGDLLFQVVYHSRLAQERGWFDFDDVARTITAKMIRRHPHVFGEAAAPDWEAAKAAERPQSGALDGIAATLPAIATAAKLTARAARVGFDWPNPGAVLDKLDEEIAELRAELAEADAGRLQDELGDVLFVLVNLARKLGLSAESALAGANGKFRRRFRFIEAELAAAGRTPAESSLDEMDGLWDAAKRCGL